MEKHPHYYHFRVEQTGEEPSSTFHQILLRAPAETSPASPDSPRLESLKALFNLNS